MSVWESLCNILMMFLWTTYQLRLLFFQSVSLHRDPLNISPTFIILWTQYHFHCVDEINDNEINSDQNIRWLFPLSPQPTLEQVATLAEILAKHQEVWTNYNCSQNPLIIGLGWTWRIFNTRWNPRVDASICPAGQLWPAAEICPSLPPRPESATNPRRTINHSRPL